MWKNPTIIFNKKPIFEKLIEYGFIKQEQYYIFSTDIMDGHFYLTIYVSENGITELQVNDKDTEEEYSPVYVEGATGSFVSCIRSECMSILTELAQNCYEPDIFKTEYAKLIIKYIRNKYGSEAEYLWEKFPNNAVFRDAETEKWYAALLTVEKRKIGINESGIIEIIDLKEIPEKVAELVDKLRYLPGYHMNKKHWYTICLDGSVEIEEIYERIDNSFQTLSIKNKTSRTNRPQ